MSNIHGLRDLEDNNRTPLVNQNNQPRRAPFVVFNDNKINPRDESFWYMIRMYLLSRVHFFSFGILASLFFLVIFILQIIIDGVDIEMARMELLPINWFGPLTSRMFDGYTFVWINREYYRLVSSLIVHGNFAHVFGNTVSLVVWVNIFTGLISDFKILQIFLLSGNLTRNIRKYLLTGLPKPRCHCIGRIDRSHRNHGVSFGLHHLQLASTGSL
jgi:membrane associated rhomboid family serine protease